MVIRMKPLLLLLLVIHFGTSSAEQLMHPTLPPRTETPEGDEFLGPAECLQKKFTRASCDLVFCPPWERCIGGHCICKSPYMCPLKNVSKVCGRDSRPYLSYCQVMAVSCRTKNSIMSHFGSICGARKLKFQSSMDQVTGAIQIFMPDAKNPREREELLVCWELWDMAAANVVCREHGSPLGAAAIGSNATSGSCVSVRCQGYETSLAECVIYDKTPKQNIQVATATCYNASHLPQDCGFRCVNSKCVSQKQACDGVDDCGDRSDEMCCKKCRNGSFLCKTGVCVHRESVRDNQMDCLDGADESPKHTTVDPKEQLAERSLTQNSVYVSPKQETIVSREHLELRLQCGVPNRTIVDVHERGSACRVMVGELPANPTQFQWQVVLERRKKMVCGGAYIGGCWVITAAHCVRTDPSAFTVKFSFWKMSRAQDTTDLAFVENFYIHPGFNESSHENDIALVKLKHLPFTDKCLEDNPAISAVCVPWTRQLFKPNHTCSISGWGQTAGGRRVQTLLWANVSLTDDCPRFYKDILKPGMTCTGDLNGGVNICQWDSGSPLVCEDELGVSYLWGLISWGERCDRPGFPGIYTEVAHYFEWIRFHTGWSAVTKFNS